MRYRYMTAKAGFTLAEGATHVDTPPTTAKETPISEVRNTHVGMPPITAKETSILEVLRTHVNLSPTATRFGFTLAEVLITLGIIGIVAAMTMPSLFTACQKRQYLARLKKSYNTVSQALMLAEEENGGVGSLDMKLNGSKFFHTYIANHIKYTEEYSTSQLKTKRISKLLNGSSYTGTTFNGAGAYHFLLVDGSMITMNLNSTGDAGLWVAIDVNGLNMPNTIGKDTYLYFLSSEYGLVPLGEKGTPSTWYYGAYSRDKIGPKGTVGNACAKGKTGYYCAALIMRDGWQMASDYPW